jgi:DNA ligase (NAD+)
MVAHAGGTVKGSVGKGLTYLVLADPNSTSSKAVAARKHGTECLSEEDFVAMCEE